MNTSAQYSCDTPNAQMQHYQGPAKGAQAGQQLTEDWQAIADTMGGEDNYAGVGRNFKFAPFSADRAAQNVFDDQLKSLGYQNLTMKDGSGSGIDWTQDLADKNLDILTQGLEQLQKQGFLADGHLSVDDVEQLQLGRADGVTANPALNLQQFLNTRIDAIPAKSGSAESSPSNSVAAKPGPAEAALKSVPQAAISLDKAGFNTSALTATDQTLGGKQGNIEGSFANQLRHQTGLSRYQINNDVELFQARSGGQISGTSNSPRSEAFYPGSTAGESFAATYNVQGSDNVTIFQQFSGGNGPALRATVADGDRIVVNTANGGAPPTLARIEPGQDFRLQVKDLGNGLTKFTAIDIDGNVLGTETVGNTRYGSNTSDQFRYGAYMQEFTDSGMNVFVKDVQTTL